MTVNQILHRIADIHRFIQNLLSCCKTVTVFVTIITYGLVLHEKYHHDVWHWHIFEHFITWCAPNPGIFFHQTHSSFLLSAVWCTATRNVYGMVVWYILWWFHSDLIMDMAANSHAVWLFGRTKLCRAQENQHWVASISDSPKPPPQRITFTFPVLLNARCVTFVACGSSKAEIVKVSMCTLFSY